jgi:hypothetical protein
MMKIQVKNNILSLVINMFYKEYFIELPCIILMIDYFGISYFLKLLIINKMKKLEIKPKPKYRNSLIRIKIIKIKIMSKLDKRCKICKIQNKLKFLLIHLADDVITNE